MRKRGSTEERIIERRGKSEQGLGVVSCSRKYYIKEELDPRDWDFAWRQVTVGLPRTYSEDIYSNSQSTHQKQQWCQSGSWGERKRYRSLLGPLWAPDLTQLNKTLWLLTHIDTVHTLRLRVCTYNNSLFTIQWMGKTRGDSLLKIAHTFMYESGKQSSFSNNRGIMTYCHDKGKILKIFKKNLTFQNTCTKLNIYQIYTKYL